MKYQIENLPKINRGIILRNPREVLLSMMNRRSKRCHNGLCSDIIDCYIYFDKLITEQNIRFINFHKMVSDVKYTKDLLEFFDIFDVTITKELITTKKI